LKGLYTEHSLFVRIGGEFEIRVDLCNFHADLRHDGAGRVRYAAGQGSRADLRPSAGKTAQKTC
jgi:hypothetical protein